MLRIPVHDSVRSFEYFDFKTKNKKLTKSEINYGYRYTDIINSLILSVELEFTTADPSEFLLMKEFTQYIEKTQPSYIMLAVFENEMITMQMS